MRVIHWFCTGTIWEWCTDFVLVQYESDTLILYWYNMRVIHWFCKVTIWEWYTDSVLVQYENDTLVLYWYNMRVIHWFCKVTIWSYLSLLKLLGKTWKKVQQRMRRNEILFIYNLCNKELSKITKKYLLWWVITTMTRCIGRIKLFSSLTKSSSAWKSLTMLMTLWSTIYQTVTPF